MTIELGVIADDVTGACDVAAGVSAAGLDVEVRLGAPVGVEPFEASCVIIALKSRTAPAAQAVAESVAAAAALRDAGARRLYQKYCSTFDSTDAGNIGPVADALLDELSPTAVSVGTPATPAVERTMHRGHLFVGDRLLSESSLATHPLTPMRDPDLVRVLGRQSRRAVGSVPIEVVRVGAEAIRAHVDELRSGHARHVLLDAVEDADLDAAAAALVDEPDALLGGAAGLAVALARRLAVGREHAVTPAPTGRGLILSGSGSERTRAQVAAHTGPAFTLLVDDLAADSASTIGEALRFVDDAAERGVSLITATAEPDEVGRAQERWGRDRAAALVEDALARIAVEAVEHHGVRRMLVAGGETSGAITAALGARVLRVRRVVAPGVAWMTTTDAAGHDLDLCLKSGNFGGEDLFRDAWEEFA